MEASQLVCGAKLRGNYKFLVNGELWSPAKHDFLDFFSRFPLVQFPLKGTVA